MTETQAKPRKVAKIVLDRPPLKDVRLILFTALGFLGGIILGGILFLLERYENADFPEILESHEQQPYIWFWVLAGGLVGFILGWCWDRSVTARIEMVEAPGLGRRRATSTGTSLVRVDVSGRSRY